MGMAMGIGMKHDVKSSSSASKKDAFSKLFAFLALLHHHIAAPPRLVQPQSPF
jgi:hypothetical protein